MAQNSQFKNSQGNCHMASGFFMLMDDIAAILDDVAVLTKVAAKKTAGVLGDDLALNAQQVIGIEPNRELPVVWAVAKGSFLNKCILVPAALLLSAFLPWLIQPLLIAGGAYLCYEGVEKIAHKLFHRDEEAKHIQEHEEIVADAKIDIVAVEKQKIAGAIRTDFILSAEIIVITLGTVAEYSFPTQVAVLIAIGILMTVGVYGLVAAIVKLDDLGLRLVKEPANGIASPSRVRLGRALLIAAPILMKFLSIAGTAAMFLVGGGILVHGISDLHHWLEDLIHGIEDFRPLGGVLAVIVEMLLHAILGVIVGIVVLVIVNSIKSVLFKKRTVEPA
ncbi:MAG: DUF808 domain-containing protein [Pirellulaceae bacterium]